MVLVSGWGEQSLRGWKYTLKEDSGKVWFLGLVRMPLRKVSRFNAALNCR